MSYPRRAFSAVPLIFPAAGRHTATFIFAHGLGDTAHGWTAVVENWRLRHRLDEVKFVLPNAPILSVTCNGGMRMPAWFDLANLDGTQQEFEAGEDREGLILSRDYIHTLIRDELNDGIPSHRVVLGGFSQGASCAILAGLTYPTKIAAIVAMSGWMPLNRAFRDNILPGVESNRETPILLCYGLEDHVVPIPLGRMTWTVLVDICRFKAEMKEYPHLGHSASPEELDDVEAFVIKALPPQGDSPAGTWR